TRPGSHAFVRKCGCEPSRSSSGSERTVGESLQRSTSFSSEPSDSGRPRPSLRSAQLSCATLLWSETFYWYLSRDDRRLEYLAVRFVNYPVNDFPILSDFRILREKNMRSLAIIRRLKRDTRGANMVEYIILVGVVALLAIVAFKYFNASVKTKVNQQADSVNKINGVE